MHIGIDARLVYYTRAGIGEYTLRLTQALANTFSEHRFTLLRDRRDKQPLLQAPNVTGRAPLCPATIASSSGSCRGWSMAWALTCSTARISSRR